MPCWVSADRADTSPRTMDHPLKDTGESPVSVDQEIAGQAGGQLKGDTRSLPDQQKK